jgi:hypothetical protein
MTTVSISDGTRTTYIDAKSVEMFKQKEKPVIFPWSVGNNIVETYASASISAAATLINVNSTTSFSELDSIGLWDGNDFEITRITTISTTSTGDINVSPAVINAYPTNARVIKMPTDFLVKFTAVYQKHSFVITGVVNSNILTVSTYSGTDPMTLTINSTTGLYSGDYVDIISGVTYTTCKITATGASTIAVSPQPTVSVGCHVVKTVDSQILDLEKCANNESTNTFTWMGRDYEVMVNKFSCRQSSDADDIVFETTSPGAYSKANFMEITLELERCTPLALV